MTTQHPSRHNLKLNCIITDIPHGIYRKVQTVKVEPRNMITMNSEGIYESHNLSLEMNELTRSRPHMETSGDEPVTCQNENLVQNSTKPDETEEE